ncbi:MAG TPA: CaiB/BaiF CoA-transferase family protein [Acidimicrobiales bacterium]|nr:CaiB/BaiF CoA-transferase family protein [Acidimicrobiales bacterium]
MTGPLSGYTVIELAGIGPGPFCGMMLADMGARVIRVDRAQNVSGGDPASPPTGVLERGRESIGVDLKNPDGIETVLKLVEKADVIFEGFRPGVTERLGLGPDVCLARNPKIVYGRMTGWGQDGPYAQAAGHDINYIALAGALHPIGRKGQAPVPPLNLVGDFGGGGMLLAFGIACALLEAQKSGKGQVVDAAMVDGAAILTAMFYGMKGFWTTERGTNLLDTGAHFYDVYETADGEHVSIGSIEPQFYAELRRLAGLDADEWGAQMDRSKWPELKEKIAAVFKTKTRDEWNALMEHTDVCYAPVLSLDEAHLHPHNVERGTFKTISGVLQPGPAPRFSRTSAEIQGPAAHAGQHTDDVLASLGFEPSDIAKLREAGAVK